MLMQQARHEQSKLPSSSNSGVLDKVQAPTDALSFLMQQARAGQPGCASAASTTRYLDFRPLPPIPLPPPLPLSVHALLLTCLGLGLQNL